ncbi:MAG: hypothetical protein HN606_01015 [Euryarchaeota archaeon]|nr:hypothetical protein [Euryarchaeota archaeon]
MLGMSASFGISSQDERKSTSLEDETPLLLTHSTIIDIGFSADSIYTNTTIAAGTYNGCAILENQSMVCWGDNEYGQLGDGTTTGSAVPIYVNVAANETPVEVTVGQVTACALMESGNIYCWGSGYYGKMGNGEPWNDDYVNTEMRQVLLPEGQGGQTVSISGGHICTILNNGDVYCWGRGNQGQLGYGGTSNRNIPAKVNLPGQRSAIAISTGTFMTCAITNDGMGYCWGENDEGQLGNGTTNSRQMTPVEVLFPSGYTPVSISAGDDFACALMDNRKVMCWGENNDGRLGQGPLATDDETTPVWVSMENSETAHFLDIGTKSACMILDSEETKCWGTNEEGQIGQGDTDVDYYSTPTEVNGSHDFVALSINSDTICAITSNAEGYCWGDNEAGQTGRGSIDTNEPTPSEILFTPNHLMLDDRDPDEDGILSIFDPFPRGCIPGSWFNSTLGDCQWNSPGHYTDQAELTQEIPCPIGSYQPNTGQSSCLLSSPGNYIDVEASITPTPCPDGQYQPVEGQTVCLIVDLGNFSLEGSVEQTPCPKGTFQDSVGQSTCLDADPGYYVDIKGSNSQFPCPSGTYSQSSGSHSCTNADIGYHVPYSASLEQFECSIGTYSDTVGLTDCKLASPGHYTDVTGATTDSACSFGFYQPLSGQSLCLEADPGHSVPNNGATEQIECGLGYFQSQSGSDRCTPATPGNYVNQTGASALTPCDSGYYQNQYVSTECRAADQGHYVAETGSLLQSKCEIGSFSAQIASIGCTSATPGHFVSIEGATKQTVCSNGTFQPEYGQSSCLNAEAGHFVPESDASEQIPCHTGTYQNLVAMTSCIEADPGHHVPETGMTEQIICAVGSYQFNSGQGACRAADQGHFVQTSGMTEQNKCIEGWYQPSEGEAECLQAEPGHFASGIGSVTQTECGLGTFQESPGASKCKAAHIDHYVDTIGSISQSQCPTGSSQPLVGQSKCVWPFGVESPAILFVSTGVIGILSLMAFLMIRKKLTQ